MGGDAGKHVDAYIEYVKYASLVLNDDLALSEMPMVER